MVLINTKNDKGEDDTVYLDGYLNKNLDIVKESVLKKGWDYVAVISGIPGVGKSTLAQQVLKKLDPTFNTKDRICFSGSGENGLIERTSVATPGQGFMLDESFESMNTQVTRSSEFLRVINHLQLIRQKGLFVILCLPNFFDLSKGIAIFRSSHLFVVYADHYQRGFFSAFDRERKKQLYVKGSKFMNYNVVKPNYRGKFVKKWVANERLYEKLKHEHLIKQGLRETPKTKAIMVHKNFVKHLREIEQWPVNKIAKVGGIASRTVYNLLEK